MTEEKIKLSLADMFKLADEVTKWEEYWDSRIEEPYYKGSVENINFKLYKNFYFFGNPKSYDFIAEYDGVALSRYKIKPKNDLRLKELVQDIEFNIKQQKQDKIKNNFNSIKKFVKEDEMRIKKGKIKISLDAMIELAEKVENWRKEGYGMWTTYNGSIRNGEIRVDVSKNFTIPFMRGYNISIRNGNICVDSGFYESRKYKSKIKKLYQHIKSEAEQQKINNIKDKTKKGVNHIEDLLNKKIKK